jgi:hypothetical protein
MTVYASKPAFNVREKLKEIDYGKVPYHKMPAGSVIQYASISTGTSVSTTSTSYVDTGIDILFSPKLASSKVLVTVQSRRFNLVTSDVLNIKCKRDDSVDIGIQQQSVQDGHYQNMNSTAANQIAYPLHYMWEDSPGTTSEVKYTMYIKVNAGTGYLADSGGVQLYVQEIAQ